MRKTFGILFYLKKSKINKLGKCPIYLRITIDGKRKEISTKRFIEASKWNNKANRALGRSEDVKELNSYLDTLVSKLYQCHRDLIELDKEITAESLKNKFLGNDENHKNLIPVFKNHNDQMKELIGRGYAKGTLERYNTTLKHLKDFIKFQYNITDIPLKRIDFKFITDFEFYLKSIKHCSHNTTLKYIKNFQKIIRNCLANEWIIRDPFLNFKARLKKVDRPFLTEREINMILNKKLNTLRLERVRDIFIFCCFTGLAYSDVKRLTKNNIVIGIDGNEWIKTKRKKTNSQSNIPLLPIALEIIEKYRNHPEVIHKDVLLPVLSNQNFNAYLKEIADICNILKPLSTHVARHTFATTVTLSNGIPLESVSKMLGHKSIKTTQHYAKILDLKVSEDMNIIRDKYVKNIEPSNYKNIV